MNTITFVNEAVISKALKKIQKLISKFNTFCKKIYK